MMANHEEQDRQSLMLHTEAVWMMQADPALIDRALGILERWEHIKSKPHPSHVEWKRILLERDWDAALSASERGNQIRQSSPVGCVLPSEKRLEIIRGCRASTSAFTEEEWNQRMLAHQERMETDAEYRKLMGGL